MPEQHPTTAEETHVPTAPTVPPRVLLFYDYACPFCYVDMYRFDQLRTDHPDVEFILVPMELRPDMPEEGYPVSELEFGNMSEHVHEHLIRIAEREGIPLTIPPFLPKTHKAHVLSEMSRDRGEAIHRTMHHAIFATYFAEGKDIGKAEVLLDLAEKEGFDRAEVSEAWKAGTYDERLHQFIHIAQHLGIEATPAALICNELVIGSRPLEVLKDALDRCLVHEDALDAGEPRGQE